MAAYQAHLAAPDADGRRRIRSAGERGNPPMRPATRTDLLARRDTPIARGRGAATRNQLPAASLGQPPRPAPELRDAHRQPLGLQRQQRGRDEPDAAPPWLRAPPCDRNSTNRLGVVGVLGVAQRRQDRSLLNRHQVRDCNGRSRRRLLPPAPARAGLRRPTDHAGQPALNLVGPMRRRRGEAASRRTRAARPPALHNHPAWFCREPAPSAVSRVLVDLTILIERRSEPVGDAPAGYDHPTMTESPIDTLLRWEQHGAVWRAKSVSEMEAVVDLCTCAGEPVDQLRFTDPAVLRYLADRPRSDGY